MLSPRALTHCSALSFLLCSACGSPAPSEERPPPVSSGQCRMLSVEAADPSAITARVQIQNRSRIPIDFVGQLRFRIAHSTGPGARVVACEGEVPVTAASYTGSLDEGVSVTAPMSACPPLPAGATISLETSFQREGSHTPVGCERGDTVVPPVFGGGGLGYDAQRRAVSLGAARATPEFAAMRGYADRLAAAAAALPAAAGAGELTCPELPAEAARPTLIATDYELASIGAPSESPLRAPQPGDAFTSEYALLSPALRALGRLVHEGEGDAASIQRWVDAHSPYVAVLQVRSVSPPMEHGGSLEATHTYTPGQLDGVLSLVDTRSAQIVCRHSVTHTQSGDFRQADRYGASPTSQMRQAFYSGNITAADEALRAMAPSTLAALPDAP